jgi:hypothetical protein
MKSYPGAPPSPHRVLGRSAVGDVRCGHLFPQRKDNAAFTVGPLSNASGRALSDPCGDEVTI